MTEYELESLNNITLQLYSQITNTESFFLHKNQNQSLQYVVFN